MIPLDRTPSGDRIVSKINELTTGLFTKAQLLTDVALLSATFTNVPHGLGRPAKGFFIVYSEADVRAWSDASSPDDTLFIRLKSSTNATVDLVVF